MIPCVLPSKFTNFIRRMGILVMKSACTCKFVLHWDLNQSGLNIL
jgi:hypothetical protein